eukprot:4164493-Amphidinium_carterae.1
MLSQINRAPQRQCTRAVCTQHDTKNHMCNSWARNRIVCAKVWQTQQLRQHHSKTFRGAQRAISQISIGGCSEREQGRLAKSLGLYRASKLTDACDHRQLQTNKTRSFHFPLLRMARRLHNS